MHFTRSGAIQDGSPEDQKSVETALESEVSIEFHESTNGVLAVFASSLDDSYDADAVLRPMYYLISWL
jgi:hypothetical protein